jgi:hypothetical protein
VEVGVCNDLHISDDTFSHLHILNAPRQMKGLNSSIALSLTPTLLLIVVFYPVR